MDWFTQAALAALAALGAWSTEPERYRAIDGDTLEVVSTGERIRLSNIDAPELTGPCPTKALQAQRVAQDMVNTHTVTISRQGVDKYGRTLAAVAVDGKDLGDWLVSSGLAKRWGSKRGLC